MIYLKKGKLSIKKDVMSFYTAKITKFGNSAKINCQKKYMGKKAIVLILEDE